MILELSYRSRASFKKIWPTAQDRKKNIGAQENITLFNVISREIPINADHRKSEPIFLAMDSQSAPVEAETDVGTNDEISSEELSHFLLGATCTASIMQLSNETEPYAHGAVAVLMAKSLFRSLEVNCCAPPRCLVSLNETTCKLSKFVPWTMLNVELYRRSGLLDGWNESIFGLLLAAAVPTVLAATTLKEKYFNNAVKVVSGLNLLGLGYLAAKQQNYWSIGMATLCALDSFCIDPVARCLRVSETNARNISRIIFAGTLPFYMKSL